TESCGYTVADQEKLLARWRRELEGRPIIVVESKSDLRPKSRSDRLQISTVTGEGIDALRTAIRAATPVMAPAPPVEEEPVFEMTEEERSSDRMHRRRKPRHSDATIEPGAPE
ncbi:MAG: hypothetical protein ACREB9_03715, partial [Thermoplasmata archaeon]